jgi:hypothetical protein
VNRIAVAACAALAIALVAGCGGDDSDGESKRPDDVPAGSVAVVGDSEISERELDRRVEALSRSTRSRSSTTKGSTTKGGSSKAPHTSPAQRRQLESQALSGLLHEKAIEQEAADRGVSIDPREVRRRWNSARQGQFANEKAVKRFLGGQTEQDVLRQLRLQLLTEKVHDEIRAEDGDAAVTRFQRDLQKRWTDRTACRPRYAALGCGDDGAK